MGIRFDGNRAIADLVEILKIDLLLLEREIIAEASAKMRSQEARKGLTPSEVEQVATVISVSIIGDAWAVMDEWGTGSKMDMSNPALREYMGGPMWNPARYDRTIRSRPDTDGQIDIFGRSVRGYGEGGRDLEITGEVEALAPSHAVKTAMRWMGDKRFVEKINKTLKRFPFGNYIIITNP